MRGGVSRLWQQPSAVLLGVQLSSVLLYPFMALVISRVVGLTISRQRG